MKNIIGISSYPNGTPPLMARAQARCASAWLFHPPPTEALAPLAQLLKPPAIVAFKGVSWMDLLQGALLGAFNVLSNVTIAWALMDIEGTIAFPLRRAGMVVGSAVLGWLIWKERLNRSASIGVVLAAVAAVLLGR